VLLFALAAWGFATNGYAAYLIVIVSGFLLIAVGLPLILWRIWKNRRSPNEPPASTGSLVDWAKGLFETWQDRREAMSALVEVFIPIAAAAIGMMAFAVIFHVIAQVPNTAGLKEESPALGVELEEPRPRCKTCRHPERARIEVELGAGRGLVSVGKD
jgi:hypothetical protein